jgi:hypothetical protein
LKHWSSAKATPPTIEAAHIPELGSVVTWRGCVQDAVKTANLAEIRTTFSNGPNPLAPVGKKVAGQPLTAVARLQMLRGKNKAAVTSLFIELGISLDSGSSP